MADFGQKQRRVDIEGFFIITHPNEINAPAINLEALGVNVHNFRDDVGERIQAFIIEMLTHGYGFDDELAIFTMKLHSNNINIQVDGPDQANRFQVSINFLITYSSAAFHRPDNSYDDYSDTDIDNFRRYFYNDFSSRIYTIFDHPVVIMTDFPVINVGPEEVFVAGNEPIVGGRRSKKTRGGVRGVGGSRGVRGRRGGRSRKTSRRS